jgi:hypothetical protein
MSQALIVGPDAVRNLVAEGRPFLVIDVRGRSAYRRATERVEGDVRAHGVGMMHLARGRPDDTTYLLYCT